MAEVYQAQLLARFAATHAYMFRNILTGGKMHFRKWKCIQATAISINHYPIPDINFAHIRAYLLSVFFKTNRREFNKLDAAQFKTIKCLRLTIYIEKSDLYQ